MIKIRKPFESFDKTKTRRPIITKNTTPTRTKQALADELDVNKIVHKYQATGILQKANNFEAVYGEFTSTDLQDSIEKVEKAQQMFMEIPSQVRSQFNNDAGAFIDYATNPQNIRQLVKWGLATPSEIPSSATDDAIPVEKPNKVPNPSKPTETPPE